MEALPTATDGRPPKPTHVNVPTGSETHKPGPLPLTTVAQYLNKFHDINSSLNLTSQGGATPTEGRQSTVLLTPTMPRSTTSSQNYHVHDRQRPASAVPSLGRSGTRGGSTVSPSYWAHSQSNSECLYLPERCDSNTCISNSTGRRSQSAWAQLLPNKLFRARQRLSSSFSSSLCSFPPGSPTGQVEARSERPHQPPAPEEVCLSPSEDPHSGTNEGGHRPAAQPPTERSLSVRPVGCRVAQHTPTERNLEVAPASGEWTLQRLRQRLGQARVLADNDHFTQSLELLLGLQMRMEDDLYRETNVMESTNTLPIPREQRTLYVEAVGREIQRVTALWTASIRDSQGDTATDRPQHTTAHLAAAVHHRPDVPIAATHGRSARDSSHRANPHKVLRVEGNSESSEEEEDLLTANGEEMFVEESNDRPDSLKRTRSAIDGAINSTVPAMHDPFLWSGSSRILSDTTYWDDGALGAGRNVPFRPRKKGHRPGDAHNTGSMWSGAFHDSMKSISEAGESQFEVVGMQILYPKHTRKNRDKKHEGGKIPSINLTIAPTVPTVTESREDDDYEDAISHEVESPVHFMDQRKSKLSRKTHQCNRTPMTAKNQADPVVPSEDGSDVEREAEEEDNEVIHQVLQQDLQRVEPHRADSFSTTKTALSPCVATPTAAHNPGRPPSAPRSSRPSQDLSTRLLVMTPKRTSLPEPAEPTEEADSALFSEAQQQSAARDHHDLPRHSVMIGDEGSTAPGFTPTKHMAAAESVPGVLCDSPAAPAEILQDRETVGMGSPSIGSHRGRENASPDFSTALNAPTSPRTEDDPETLKEDRVASHDECPSATTSSVMGEVSRSALAVVPSPHADTALQTNLSCTGGLEAHSKELQEHAGATVLGVSAVATPCQELHGAIEAMMTEGTLATTDHRTKHVMTSASCGLEGTSPSPHRALGTVPAGHERHLREVCRSDAARLVCPNCGFPLLDGDGHASPDSQLYKVSVAQFQGGLSKKAENTRDLDSLAVPSQNRNASGGVMSCSEDVATDELSGADLEARPTEIYEIDSNHMKSDSASLPPYADSGNVSLSSCPHHARAVWMGDGVIPISSAFPVAATSPCRPTNGSQPPSRQTIISGALETEMGNSSLLDSAAATPCGTCSAAMTPVKSSLSQSSASTPQMPVMDRCVSATSNASSVKSRSHVLTVTSVSASTVSIPRGHRQHRHSASSASSAVPYRADKTAAIVMAPQVPSSVVSDSDRTPAEKRVCSNLMPSVDTSTADVRSVTEESSAAGGGQHSVLRSNSNRRSKSYMIEPAVIRDNSGRFSSVSSSNIEGQSRSDPHVCLTKTNARLPGVLDSAELAPSSSQSNNGSSLSTERQQLSFRPMSHAGNSNLDTLSRSDYVSESGKSPTSRPPLGTTTYSPPQPPSIAELASPYYRDVTDDTGSEQEEMYDEEMYNEEGETLYGSSNSHHGGSRTQATPKCPEGAHIEEGDGCLSEVLNAEDTSATPPWKHGRHGETPSSYASGVDQQQLGPWSSSSMNTLELYPKDDNSEGHRGTHSQPSAENATPAYMDSNLEVEEAVAEADLRRGELEDSYHHTTWNATPHAHDNRHTGEEVDPQDGTATPEDCASHYSAQVIMDQPRDTSLLKGTTSADKPAIDSHSTAANSLYAVGGSGGNECLEAASAGEGSAATPNREATNTDVGSPCSAVGGAGGDEQAGRDDVLESRQESDKPAMAHPSHGGDNTDGHPVDGEGKDIPSDANSGAEQYCEGGHPDYDHQLVNQVDPRSIRRDSSKTVPPVQCATKGPDAAGAESSADVAASKPTNGAASLLSVAAIFNTSAKREKSACIRSSSDNDADAGPLAVNLKTMQSLLRRQPDRTWIYSSDVISGAHPGSIPEQLIECQDTTKVHHFTRPAGGGPRGEAPPHVSCLYGYPPSLGPDGEAYRRIPAYGYAEKTTISLVKSTTHTPARPTAAAPKSYKSVGKLYGTQGWTHENGQTLLAPKDWLRSRRLGSTAARGTSCGALSSPNVISGYGDTAAARGDAMVARYYTPAPTFTASQQRHTTSAVESRTSAGRPASAMPVMSKW